MITEAVYTINPNSGFIQKMDNSNVRSLTAKDFASVSSVQNPQWIYAVINYDDNSELFAVTAVFIRGNLNRNRQMYSDLMGSVGIDSIANYIRQTLGTW